MLYEYAMKLLEWRVIMDYKILTKANIDQEHICCAISDKKKEDGVSTKKTWLKERMEEGLVFLKADVRGKVFIEYVPAEFAWAPIHAPNYMYINCFWVSGQYKGKGIANELLKRCCEDAQEKGMDGLVVLTGKMKIPFLSDPSYLCYKGFQLADESGPFTLLYLPFQEQGITPSFLDSIKKNDLPDKGFTLYYGPQCPFTGKYAALLEQRMIQANIPFTSHRFQNTKDAQRSPSPCTTFALFYAQQFLTNEILSEKKIAALITRYANGTM